MPAPLLSIVIPTLNEELYLGVLLNSLSEQFIPWPFEVVVVDSSLDNRTVSVAKTYASSLPVRALSWSIQDAASQRNAGAATARGTYLLFLDADVLLSDRSAVWRTLQLLEPQELGVVSIRHHPDTPRITVRCLMLLVYALIGAALSVGLPVTNGDFLLTNRRTVEDLGGFMEGFLVGEDTDFGFRVRRRGGRTLMNWQSSVTASSRRLSITAPHQLIAMWAYAYLRNLLGRGPTGSRLRDDMYPFGHWAC
jgi:glycosyltransferase involved in cell wall biosynthesis